MQGDIRRLITQPAMAMGTSFTACGSIALAVIAGFRSGTPLLDKSDLLLGAGLAASIVLAYQFPIYIRHHTKLCLVSAPLLLAAVLVSPVLAGCLTLVAITLGELTVMKGRGALPADIATIAGRWTIAVVPASMLTHSVPASAGPVARFLPMVAAALLMWVIDAVSLPLALTPIGHERPAHIIASTVREGGIAELAQYSLGLLGVLLALQARWAILFLLAPAALIHMAFNKELDPDTFQLLENMADSVDLRGSYTVGHSRRVRDLVEGILDELNVHRQEAAQILTASRLHDVGKIGLPDDLLVSSGGLTPAQQSLLESYPELGAELMREYPDFSRGLEMVRHHHERWDGMGYPGKLAGTDIPFGARVIAVADSFDAMTSERPYRRALTVEQAARILVDGAGRQWDPDVVPAFLRSLGSRLEPPLLANEPGETELAIPDALLVGQRTR